MVSFSWGWEWISFRKRGDKGVVVDGIDPCYGQGPDVRFCLQILGVLPEGGPLARKGDKGVSKGSQLHAPVPFLPDQQGRAQLLLQLLDAGADGGLGEKKPLGGGGYGTVGNDGKEGLDMFVGHNKPPAGTFPRSMQGRALQVFKYRI